MTAPGLPGPLARLLRTSNIRTRLTVLTAGAVVLAVTGWLVATGG